MISNAGIGDMQVAVGKHKNHQGRIDYAPGNQCLQLSGATCFQPVGAALFQAVDGILKGFRSIFVGRDQIKKASCEVAHIVFSKT